MKKINVLGEMSDKRLKQNANQTAIIKTGDEDMLLLGAGDIQADIRNLRALGLSHDIDKVEKIRGKVIERQEREKNLGTTYHISDIRDICLKWRLKFLHTKEFMGVIDPKLGKIIDQVVFTMLKNTKGLRMILLSQ